MRYSTHEKIFIKKDLEIQKNFCYICYMKAELKKTNLTAKSIENFKKALPYSKKKYLYELIEQSSEETLAKISKKIKSSKQ